MKIKIEKTVPFYAVDQTLALYPRVLLNYFQEAVGVHSKKAEDHIPALMEKGQAWILSRIGLAIRRWPGLDDPLTISTWHTRDKGFKAFRDFEIRSGNEVLVLARTMWLFIDLNTKKILRIPKTTSQAYTCEPELDLDMDLDTWLPATKFTPESTCSMGIRSSDYDPLGHVNNALYFDYLHHLIASALPGPAKPSRIMLQYVKEIPMKTGTVQMGLLKEEDGYLFKIYSDDCIHAAGAFVVGG